MTDLYRFYNSTGDLLYVGISLSAIDRASRHKREKSWWPEVARMNVEHLSDDVDALAVERTAILTESPRYNVVHNREVPGGPAAVERLIAQAVAQGFTPKVTDQHALAQAAGVLKSQCKLTAAFTVPEFADAFGICRATVYNLINRGELRAIKIGSSRRILAADAQQFIERVSA